MRSSPAAILLALAAASLPANAFAHTGLGHAEGLAQGFLHPLGGPDHLIAMVAVGLLAASLGGRALWLVPASFLAMMAAGGALAVAGVGVPFVEVGIAASVLVLGLAIALQWSLPTAAAMVLAGFFAIFHGQAHGAEMPGDASGLDYGLGFLAATALLHLAGMAAGLGIGRTGARWAGLTLRAGGGGAVLAGLLLLVGRA